MRYWYVCRFFRSILRLYQVPHRHIFKSNGLKSMQVGANHFVCDLIVFPSLVADVLFLTVFVESAASRMTQQQAACRAWVIPIS